MRLKLLLILLLFVHLSHGQGNIGLIFNIDDSVNHQYIGLTIFQLVQKQYACPPELNEKLLELTKSYLGKMTKGEVVEIAPKDYLIYQQKKNELRKREFKKYETKWFLKLRDTYKLSSIVIMQNTPSIRDVIHNSKYALDGFGFYNGPYKKMNNIYFCLKTNHIYQSTNEDPISLKSEKYLGENFYKSSEEYPRITDKEQTISEDQIIEAIPIISDLLNVQIMELLAQPEFLKNL